MFPFTKRSRFPNIVEKWDGSISFRHTPDETCAIHMALEAISSRSSQSVDRDSERKKIIALALYVHAAHLIAQAESPFRTKLYRSAPHLFKHDIGFAVAASWKGYVYFPFPILLHQRAQLLWSLGMKESQELLGTFYDTQRTSQPDPWDQTHLEYAGADIQAALSNAEENLGKFWNLAAC